MANWSGIRVQIEQFQFYQSKVSNLEYTAAEHRAAVRELEAQRNRLPQANRPPVQQRIDRLEGRIPQLDNQIQALRDTRDALWPELRQALEHLHLSRNRAYITVVEAADLNAIETLRCLVDAPPVAFTIANTVQTSRAVYRILEDMGIRLTPGVVVELRDGEYRVLDRAAAAAYGYRH